MQSKWNRNRILLGVIATVVWAGVGCNTSSEGLVLYADAEYDPPDASDVQTQIHETSLQVAQTYTVLQDGKLDSFQLVVTQGTPGGAGMLQVDVRPLLMTGEPENTDANSIITPLMIDTATLPLVGVEDYTVFDVSQQVTSRQVTAGEEFAIVFTFLSRSTGTMGQPIAYVYGRTGDEYLDGSASTNPDGMGFMNDLNDDYFFRTFLLIRQ